MSLISQFLSVASDADLDAAIKISADHISKLRKSNVFRVMDEAPAKIRKRLAAHIVKHRPEFHSEIEDWKKETSEIVVAKEEKTHYHVTHTEYVPSIKKHGLRPKGAPTNWVKAKDKSCYGKGEVHSFDNHHDAVKWGAKMDWHLHGGMGTGKISIVHFHPHKKQTEDTNDPLSHAGSKGKWWKSNHSVPASHIHKAEPLTIDHIKKAMHG